MKLTTAQREVLRALAAKGYPVKIGMHSGWNTRTMEALWRAPGGWLRAARDATQDAPDDAGE